MTFFHTQHIELNFKGYFWNRDSLVLAENGKSSGSFTFDKESGNIFNIILWSYKFHSKQYQYIIVECVCNTKIWGWRSNFWQHNIGIHCVTSIWCRSFPFPFPVYNSLVIPFNFFSAQVHWLYAVYIQWTYMLMEWSFRWGFMFVLFNWYPIQKIHAAELHAWSILLFQL